MSPKLAVVGLSIVPPIAALAIFYGRFVRKITKNVQVCFSSSTIIIIILLFPSLRKLFHPICITHFNLYFTPSLQVFRILFSIEIHILIVK